MIRTELYKEDGGVRLVRTYSDKGMMIRQTATGDEYDAAIYPDTVVQEFEETTTPVDPGDAPDGLADAAEYLLKAKLMELPETDAEPEYLNEHEPEPDYFG